MTDNHRTSDPNAGQIRRAQAGGTLMSLAGVFIVMGIITSETQYPNPPGYRSYANDISDLGGTLPPHSVITQPAAHIFDWTMIITGVMLIVGAICTHEFHRRKVLTIPTLLLGIGVLGVGVFPGNVAVLHPLFADTAFLFGALAALGSNVVTRAPFRYLAAALGMISLFFLVAGSSLLKGSLGTGGVERWIAYPVVMWMILFGGYVLGLTQQSGNASREIEEPTHRRSPQESTDAPQ